jgi:hypothetical protein
MQTLAHNKYSLSSKDRKRNKLSTPETSEGHSQTEEHRWSNKLEHQKKVRSELVKGTHSLKSTDKEIS